MRPWVGMSMMVEPDFLQAAYPLFLAGEVEMLEWSFDIIKEGYKPPVVIKKLLQEYAKSGRLVGHGVRYSLLSGSWGARQDKWLNYLKKEVKQNNYRYFTEHFGFMSHANFHKGAPLPMPLTPKTLQIGQDRLMRLQDVVQIPVGLENLAFAFNANDVKQQGEFLNKLITPINGFIILDLHNVWCQAVNFKIDYLSLIKLYPLDKVREIHLSGGSWERVKSSKNKIRRDTHDDAIPAELFDILPKILSLCKNVECLVFERLGNTFKNDADIEQFKNDFLKIKEIVAKAYADDKKRPSEQLSTIKKQFLKSNTKPLTDKAIQKQQKQLVKILSENLSVEDVKIALKNNPLFADWETNKWPIEMLETAMQITNKWG